MELPQIHSKTAKEEDTNPSQRVTQAHCLRKSLSKLKEEGEVVCYLRFEVLENLKNII